VVQRYISAIRTIRQKSTITRTGPVQKAKNDTNIEDLSMKNNTKNKIWVLCTIAGIVFAIAAIHLRAKGLVPVVLDDGSTVYMYAYKTEILVCLIIYGVCFACGLIVS
jgi:hypothetical protein